MRRQDLKVYAFIFVAWLAVALTAIWLQSVVHPKHHTSLAPYVKRSELGMSRGALLETVNAEIRTAVKSAGGTLERVTILSEKVDGAHGTVVANVYFTDAAGKHRGIVLTAQAARSLWSVQNMLDSGQVPGA